MDEENLTASKFKNVGFELANLQSFCLWVLGCESFSSNEPPEVKELVRITNSFLYYNYGVWLGEYNEGTFIKIRGIPFYLHFPICIKNGFTVDEWIENLKVIL